ncbi:MAG: HAMP domain-containing histidine kinase [Eggerthellaceae bacterium]|nr:HAMP domain-containing histidine kinase [Eggerthellaceae bacterium]
MPTTYVEGSAQDENLFLRLYENLFKTSYVRRLSVVFAFVAAMSALVAMGLLSFAWEGFFQTYTRANVQTVADNLADAISEAYQEVHRHEIVDSRAYDVPLYPSLSAEDAAIAKSAYRIQRSLEFQVYDAHDEVIYASRGYQDSLEADKKMASTAITTSAITVDNVAVGRVEVWVTGSNVLLSQTDQDFRKQSYQVMIIAAFVSIVLATSIGFLFARRLVRPIEIISNATNKLKDGDFSARTNMDGNDEIALLGKTFDNMAENLEVDKELERRLTTDVAHELRTPLMAIQSTVEAMADGVFEADTERLNTVSLEVQRLSRLVNDMLKLGRLENKSAPMNPEVVNVGELVRLVAGTHEAYVKEAGLDFAYEPEDNVVVWGDKDMIRQITANLLSNAVRYTQSPGTITVRVHKDNTDAMIEVQDTGIGLTDEERKHVFSRFWRADESRVRETGGLGIGLAVVREIVEKHKGWIDIQSKKGEGSNFIIHLPLYNFDQIKSDSGHEHQSPLQSGQPKTPKQMANRFTIKGERTIDESYYD